MEPLSVSGREGERSEREGGRESRRHPEGYLAHNKRAPVKPYSATIPRTLWWPRKGGCSLCEKYP